MFTMDDLLEIAIKMEKNAENVYKKSADKFDDQQLKTTLEWMADEEAVHAGWFKEFKNKITLKPDEADLKQMVPKVLQDMMGEKTLSLEDIDFSTMTTVSDLFQTFIGFEQDTIAFYELLEMFIQDEPVLKGLQKIIQEEKNHIKTLESRKAFFSNKLT
ncbi:MAG: ferritin family protein [Pseudomonadota bacterium]